MLALALAIAGLEPAAPTVVDTFVAEVQPVLVTTLVGVVIAVAGLVAYALKVMVGRAKLWLDGLSTDARWRAANAKLELAAVAGVEAAEQTLARQLRAIEPVGRLDPLQGQAVLRAAVDAARSHFGPAAWAEIGAALEKSSESLADLLRSKIEAAVLRSKPTTAILGTVIDGTAIGTPPGSPAEVGPDDSTVREIVAPLDAGDSGASTR